MSIRAQDGYESVSFVKGRMNKGVDERLLPEGEYVDAQNVRLGSTETTEIGAVENSRGNEQLTTLTFAGSALSSSAVCIGAYEDGITETIYWFVHDPANPKTQGRLDSIVSYNTQAQSITYHVQSASVLNFNQKFLITGVNLIDDLLFFTDDINPPRKININRSYPSPVGPGYTDTLTDEDINVIVKPPGYSSTDTLSAPSIVMTNVAGQENYIEDRFISFAYRYKYLDDEYSATSLFTLPAFAPGVFRFSASNYVNDGMMNRFNAVNVSFNTGSELVKEVDLLYKDSNTNSIYVIERFNKEDYGWANNSTQSFLFTNSKIYTVLGSDELLRLYDNVPRTAKAQTIMGNRLIYGNYVDGYDIANSTGGKISVNFSTELVSNDIDFERLPNAVLSQGATYTLSGSNITYNNSLATFNLTDVADKLKKDSIFAFQLRLTTDQLNGDTNNPCYLPTFQNGDIQFSIQFRLPTDYNSVFDMVNSPEFQAEIGGTTFETIANCTNGTSLTDQFNCILSPPTNCPGWTKHNSSITDPNAQQSWAITSSAGSNFFSLQPIAMNFRETNAPVTNLFEYFRFESASLNFSSTTDTGSLHSNRDFETGIVYMDEYGRASTVLVSEYNTIFVPAGRSAQRNQIRATIESLPPFWATRYKFVVKPSKQNYEIIYTNFFYVRPSNNVVYFKLEGDNQNKVEKGDTLIVKKDVDGPRELLTTCEVLDISAEGEDFLNADNELGANSNQLPGLYMLIKAQNFNVVGELTNPVIENIVKYRSKNENHCAAQVNMPCHITDTSVNPNTYEVYNIPAGTVIEFNCTYGRNDRSGQNCPGKRYIFKKFFTASQDFPTLYDWAVGDNFDPNTGETTEGTPMTMTFNTQIATSAANVTCVSFAPTWQFWQDGYNGTIDTTKELFFSIRTGIPGCNNFFGDSRSDIEFELIVTRASELLVFETVPTDANAEIYFDASRDYEITNGFHMAGGDTGEQNQTASQDAVVNVPFIDCFTFGNGVESFKILDKIATKSLVMGQRALAVSNAEYKEADRFAGLSYSGLYSLTTNTNNLNEFNLGLVNFKDLEQNFGPIMKLHGRETDILCLQEDKISYVQQGKDLLSTATGTGAVVSVPQVLGKQIARIEEYGISFNPESFIQWGSNMYFTDTKRSGVLKLGSIGQAGASLQVVSDTGMRSWFRDQFIAQLNTQKLGGYDPYMDEYVLSTNDIEVPFPQPPINCGTLITVNGATAAKTYTIEVGQVISNNVQVQFVTTGQIQVTGTWNGVAGTPNPLNINNGVGTLTFNKNLNTPTTLEVTVTPTAGACSYDINPICPPETNITVVQVVLNSNQDVGEQIHVEYGWNNSQTISPYASTQATFSSNSQTACLFDAQVGVRSIGVFPYDGVNFKFRTNKLESDSYIVTDGSYKFSFLSTNQEYFNTTNAVTGIPALLSASNVVQDADITFPSTNVVKATVTPSTTPSFSLPIGNQYLYLIYDFRTTTAHALCYDASSGGDACCDCTFTCTSWSGGARQDDAANACNQPLNNTYYFINDVGGTLTAPIVGSIVYSSTTCDSTQTLPQGFYRYSSGYLNVNNLGIVTQVGTC